MFIIRSGEINIVDHDEDHQENVIATLGNNSFFGELALLDDSARSASAIATTQTDIFAFFRADLDRLLDAVPHIGLKVYRALAIIIGIRLKTTNEQLFNK
jgi:CRP-like cAMP-binding protein